MIVNINAYKEMLNQPWGKIMYRLIFAQLSHIKDKQVLDFGAGFGTTSEYLSQIIPLLRLSQMLICFLQMAHRPSLKSMVV
ncbi:Methylase involved in ubiquinone/menaquinone biosynthesis [Streptococcus infantarius subsp. infantarius]|nr:Methylase involved in ubiquinone/menaquinone biosynthesis [Streptococcus infantarius subsp. infantarius]